MTWTNPAPHELAADWIACGGAGGVGSEVSNGLAGLLVTDFPRTEPQLTWDTIILIKNTYPESDFYSETKTEAQQICGTLAAGPVEDLLSYHGSDFIEKFESEAHRDRRMAWLLGGAWQFQMTDDVWQRVRLASDDTYWNR